MRLNPSTLIDVIACDDAQTLPGLFFRRVERDPDGIAYCEHRDGEWVTCTWAHMAYLVGRTRAALDRAALRPGDRVAVLLPNGVDWVAFDLAAMANGLITVPMYIHDSPENNAFILANSGARLCLVDTIERWAPLVPRLKDCGGMERVWVKAGDPQSVQGAQNISAFSDVLNGDDVKSSDIRCSSGDVATIIHTSGTTGRPKGVALSHYAVLWNTEAVIKFIPPLKSDVFLSLLPLAHAFERIMGYYLPMMGGARVTYMRSIDTLREDFALIRPTVLIAVPRVYERVHTAVQSQAAGNRLKLWLMQLAGNIGWRLYEAQHGRADRPPVVQRCLLWPLLKRFVAGRVLSAFGGRLRVAVSGGAPLPTEVSRFLIGLGLPLVEGYGLTEAGPVVTATTFEDNMPGSVGQPLDGLQIRLGDNDELLIRSPSIMKGYWMNPSATESVLSPDGWLRTGDIAQFRDGRVFITGRLKEIIVLSTGKKIVPTVVESAIERDPLFPQVCVIGDRRASLVAIVVLDRQRWGDFAREQGLENADINDPAVAEAVLSRLSRATSGLPSYSQLRAVHMILRPWTVDDGVLTPTLKIKRHVVEERYRQQIELLYARLAEAG